MIDWQFKVWLDEYSDWSWILGDCLDCPSWGHDAEMCNLLNTPNCWNCLHRHSNITLKANADFYIFCQFDQKLSSSSNVQFNKKFNVISSKEGRYSKIVSTKYDSRNEAIAFQMQSEDNKIMKNGWLAGLASNTQHSGISCDQYSDHSHINTVQKWQQFI